jgi:hypothetical protein
MADAANRLQGKALHLCVSLGVVSGAEGRLFSAASGQVKAFSLKSGV